METRCTHKSQINSFIFPAKATAMKTIKDPSTYDPIKDGYPENTPSDNDTDTIEYFRYGYYHHGDNSQLGFLNFEDKTDILKNSKQPVWEVCLRSTANSLENTKKTYWIRGCMDSTEDLKRFLFLHANGEHREHMWFRHSFYDKGPIYATSGSFKEKDVELVGMRMQRPSVERDYWIANSFLFNCRCILIIPAYGHETTLISQQYNSIESLGKTFPPDSNLSKYFVSTVKQVKQEPFIIQFHKDSKFRTIAYYDPPSFLIDINMPHEQKQRENAIYTDERIVKLVQRLNLDGCKISARKLFSKLVNNPSKYEALVKTAIKKEKLESVHHIDMTLEWLKTFLSKTVHTVRVHADLTVHLLKEALVRLSVEKIDISEFALYKNSTVLEDSSTLEENGITQGMKLDFENI